MKKNIFHFFCALLPTMMMLGACSEKDQADPELRVRTLVTSEVSWSQAMVKGEILYNDQVNASAMGFVYGEKLEDVLSRQAAQTLCQGDEFSSLLTELSTETVYYVSAFAEVGSTRYYGPVATFVTTKEYGLSVTSDSPAYSSVMARSVQLDGVIVDDHGRRISYTGAKFWKADQSEDQATEIELPVSPTTAPTNGGKFSAGLTGLVSGTAYKARLWARNGPERAYTELIEFSTLATSLPQVTTGTLDDATLKQTTAKITGNVAVSDGNDDLTEYGVYFYLVADDGATPNANWIKVSATPVGGTFDATVTGLTKNTDYIARAYGENEKGLALGAKVSFQTLDLIAPTAVSTKLLYADYDATVTGTSDTKLGPDYVYLYGQVTSNGGGVVSAYGIKWGTVRTNLTNDVPASNIDANGKFWIKVGSQAAGTIIWYSAYATNEAGTGAATAISVAIPAQKEQWIKSAPGGTTTVANAGVMLSYRELDQIEVATGEFYVFLDRNLGATGVVSNVNASLYNGVSPDPVAQSAGMFNTIGDYYVFGNPKPSLTIDATGSPTALDIKGVDITVTNVAGNISGGEWTLNQPCPAGYHIPTAVEWGKIIAKYNAIADKPTRYSTAKGALKVSGTSFLRPPYGSTPTYQFPINYNQYSTFLLGSSQNGAVDIGTYMHIGYSTGSNTPDAIALNGFNNANVAKAAMPVRCMRVELTTP